MAIEDETGFAWWDAVLVASASIARCKLFSTEAMQGERQILGLGIIDPIGRPRIEGQRFGNMCGHAALFATVCRIGPKDRPQGPRDGAMKKPGNGGNGGGRRQGGGEPEHPEEGSNDRRRSPERALVVSATLVALLFLIHLLVLFLVEPFKILHLSKLNAYAMSSIPLGMGLVFFLDAIRAFQKIKVRSALHFFPFLVAVVFGSLSIQGLLGFVLYLVRHPPGF